MGPSGSGKTTLLNCLSGRTSSPNIEVFGEVYLNGEQVRDFEVSSRYFAYVMQDDVLLDTMTPRGKSFIFIKREFYFRY